MIGKSSKGFIRIFFEIIRCCVVRDNPARTENPRKGLLRLPPPRIPGTQSTDYSKQRRHALGCQIRPSSNRLRGSKIPHQKSCTGQVLVCGGDGGVGCGGICAGNREREIVVQNIGCTEISGESLRLQARRRSATHPLSYLREREALEV